MTLLCRYLIEDIVSEVDNITRADPALYLQNLGGRTWEGKWKKRRHNIFHLDSFTKRIHFLLQLFLHF